MGFESSIIRQIYYILSMRKFPINTQKNRGIPINAHPGAFGNARKYDFHTGVDLYGTPGDWVYAIEDGEILSIDRFTGKRPDSWWLPTDAIIVKSENHNWVYGEIIPNSTLKIGDIVKAGQLLGELTPVLPPEKLRLDIPKHSVTMLHLEKYDNTYELDMGWAIWKERLDRPKYLLDPTNDLIDILQSSYRKVELLSL